MKQLINFYLLFCCCFGYFYPMLYQCCAPWFHRCQHAALLEDTIGHSHLWMFAGVTGLCNIFAVLGGR